MPLSGPQAVDVYMWSCGLSGPVTVTALLPVQDDDEQLKHSLRLTNLLGRGLLCCLGLSATDPGLLVPSNAAPRSKHTV